MKHSNCSAGLTARASQNPTEPPTRRGTARPLQGFLPIGHLSIVSLSAWPHGTSLGLIPARPQVGPWSSERGRLSAWSRDGRGKGTHFTIKGSVEALFKINWRISSLTLGRPRCREWQRRRQNNRKPRRCQDTTVSAWTTNRAFAQSGHQRRSAIQNSRSRCRKRGRGCLRLSTVSCWRRAAASRPRRCRGRKNARK